jgi:hypothetical protein
MPEPFPWESPPDQGERYISIDPVILQAIREFAWVTDYDRHTLPAVRLLMRVARIDPVTDNLVIGVRLVRDLNEGGQEHGLDSI